MNLVGKLELLLLDRSLRVDSESCIIFQIPSKNKQNMLHQSWCMLDALSGIVVAPNGNLNILCGILDAPTDEPDTP